MSEFVLDHVVIRTPDRDGFVRRLAEAAGRTALRGYSTYSRGVRFANGPFLDVFQAETAGTALILGGSIDGAERLAADRGWAARVDRRESRSADQAAYPWSMVLFRRGQGLLTLVGVIEYAAEPQAWTDPDFSGGLYRDPPVPGAALSRVWLGTPDLDRAERDLMGLGLGPAAPARSAFWPREGRRLQGRGVDLILFQGEEGVARLDVATGAGTATEIVMRDAPRVILDEAV